MVLPLLVPPLLVQLAPVAAPGAAAAGSLPGVLVYRPAFSFQHLYKHSSTFNAPSPHPSDLSKTPPRFWVNYTTLPAGNSLIF